MQVLVYYDIICFGDDMFSVIFDMDGTLLDTQRICIPAWEYAGLLQGITGMGDHIVNVCGVNHEGSNKYLKDNFPTLDIDRFRADSLDYINENMIVRFKSGAKELLDYLKKRNIKVALATGTSRKSVEHHLKEVGIEDYFDALVCGTEIENGKPAPDIFLKCASLLGVNPEDCFVFEDSANGIKGGFTAGMKCIGVPDIVEFDSDTKKMLFREMKTLNEAIELFESLD